MNLYELITDIRYKSTQSKWLVASAGASLAWYICLFPGRIGFDPVLAMRMMKVGESTDWWTAIYFWFLRLTTFFGQSIWLASLVSLVIIYFSMIYFLFSFNENRERIEKISFITCLSPLFGNFAVNVNHDIFLTSGSLLLIGYSLRHHFGSSKKIDKFVPFLSILFLMNGKTGYFIIISFLLFLLIARRSNLEFLGSSLFAVAVFLISSIGITKTPVPMHFLPALADIKCVAQHPEARISSKEWNYLYSLSTEEKWKDPKTCSSMDIAISEVRSTKLERMNSLEFLKNYFSIATNNPAIVIQAHLQRASIALPPPFFQGPENQTDRNINNPVGLNTNTALQLGPIVLHPSIDDEKLKIHNSALRLLESAALLFSFLINQASWFWGWGGLWLWPIFVYIIFTIRERRPKKIIELIYPIVVTHILLVAVGPIPAPRYAMTTILVGFVILLFLLSNLLSNTKKTDANL